MKGARRPALVLALALPLAACGRSGGEEPAVRAAYGERFVLALGESAEVGGEFRIRFDRVSEDSRCPADVRCAQAGNAAAAFGIEGQRGSATLTLHTGREPRSAAAIGGEVSLTELVPLPTAVGAPATEDYRAKLVVRAAP